MTEALRRPLRVLIVDDSAFNRRSLAELISEAPGLELVGKAADGEEALKLVALYEPDVLTLDLEMPRMDGFTFLRILMSKSPMPVIVVSSYSKKENVFKALELGAMDFIAKPDRQPGVDLTAIRAELLEKLELARVLRPNVASRARAASFPTLPLPEPPLTPGQLSPPRQLVAMGASTGGPSALVEVLSALPARLRAAVLIAQHMPDRFTKTFAERLNRRSPLQVSEAEDGVLVTSGQALVCPGGFCLEVAGRWLVELRASVVAPTARDRYIPSADRLMTSVASIARERSVGVVLTGMGDDGLEGARAIRDAGGVVLAESEQSAVIFGMPGSVVRAGLASEVLDLPAIADYLAQLA